MYLKTISLLFRETRRLGEETYYLLNDGHMLSFWTSLSASNATAFIFSGLLTLHLNMSLDSTKLKRQLL